VAAFLNVTQDHLDWHVDMAEYVADKARIFGRHTLRVLNRDDAALLPLCTPDTHTFGLNPPHKIGDLGVVQDGGMVWLAAAVNADPDRKLKKTESADVAVNRLMPAQALRLRGSHNHSNALAALLLARAAGVGMANMLHGLRSFEVAANRCELLCVINDVEYINDSKGTNVGATVAALNGLGENRQRLILLAGGAGKGQDFAPLQAAVKLQCKAVVCFGQDGANIATAIASAGVPIHRVNTLLEATALAASLASTGEAVLMSPACASFDQFDNYAHRAQVFRNAVAQLVFDQGVMQ
jgi:UDP-N-acetylmuramoylalanine--D-glutamate ligase